VTAKARRYTAWETRFTPEDVVLARRMYEAWRQAIVDWTGSEATPTWSDLCGHLGADGPKPWLAAAAVALQPHPTCGWGIAGVELTDDNCRLRHRGHTCRIIGHNECGIDMHYCSCMYSWPVALAAEPVEVRS
jgi:hypothetical protein